MDSYQFSGTYKMKYIEVRLLAIWPIWNPVPFVDSPGANSPCIHDYDALTLDDDSTSSLDVIIAIRKENEIVYAKQMTNCDRLDFWSFKC
jgi:hypothetical protein